MAGRILKWLKEAVEWAVAIWHVVGWFGGAALVTGIAAAIGGGIWAVLTGIPLPIAMMAAYCTFVGAVYLTMAPMAYRALAHNIAPEAAIAPPKLDLKAWRQVKVISLNDAAAVWCGCDPHSRSKTSDVKTRLTIFLDAVRTGELTLVVTGDADNYDMQRRRAFPEGWHSVTRAELQRFAKARGDDPEFLRDA